MPARIRSGRISCSNSANTESKPAIARPVGVVRSSASVSDTKPTPSEASSFSVTTRSTSEDASMFVTAGRILAQFCHKMERQIMLMIQGPVIQGQGAAFAIESLLEKQVLGTSVRN
jgi:hypothetical protein